MYIELVKVAAKGTRRGGNNTMKYSYEINGFAIIISSYTPLPCKMYEPVCVVIGTQDMLCRRFHKHV